MFQPLNFHKYLTWSKRKQFFYDFITIENIEKSTLPKFSKIIILFHRCESTNCKYLFLQPVTAEDIDPTCPRCHSNTDLLDKLDQFSQIQKLYEKGFEDMNSQKYENAIRLFIAFLDRMYAIGSPPDKKISLCQEALRTCYSQNGNISIIESCLP